MFVINLKPIKRYIAVLICAMTFGVAVFSLNLHYKSAVKLIGFTAQMAILDAGHGGQDGGAVSKNGTPEADINLAITLKSQALLKFMGIDTILTRDSEKSLDFSADASTRENKNADLYARLKLAQENEQCDFLSIHLNKFEQEQYFGAQIFYSQNSPKSAVLAGYIQDAMVIALDKNNKRAIKPSTDGVMLMKKISSPAVTIECGFLSNANEEKMLKTNEYQNKIALAISAGYVNYLEVGD